MNGVDVCIIAAVAVLFVLAVRYAWKHRGSCGGHCAQCAKACKNREK